MSTSQTYTSIAYLDVWFGAFHSNLSMKLIYFCALFHKNTYENSIVIIMTRVLLRSRPRQTKGQKGVMIYTARTGVNTWTPALEIANDIRLSPEVW